MNWLDRLERRFGFIAIPRIVMVIVALQVCTTLLALQAPETPMMLILDPVAVISGQWWRLFTYILVPSTGALNLIFAIFWFQFLWMIGQALEAQWGGFRLTLYVLSGIFFGAFVSMAGFLFLQLPILQSGIYWTLSMLLAFACLHPEVEMLLMFILPLKMRWAAWLIGAYLLYQIVTGTWPALFEVAGSMANFILFFGPMAWRNFRDRKSSLQAQHAMQSSVRQAVASLPAKACQKCGKGVGEVDLRLCLCERCGVDGKFWCVEDLKEHLKNSIA